MGSNSQMQQIEFIERLYFSKLPISKSTENILKDIMQIEKTEKYTLSGKTGWGMRDDMNNGWFVGYVESKGAWDVFFFYSRMTEKKVGA